MIQSWKPNLACVDAGAYAVTIVGFYASAASAEHGEEKNSA